MNLDLKFRECIFKTEKKLSPFSLVDDVSVLDEYTFFGYAGSDEHPTEKELGNFAFVTRPIDGYNHQVFTDNDQEPSCCTIHKELFKDALSKLRNRDNPFHLAKKIVLQVSYMEHFILSMDARSENKGLSDQSLKYIYEYIEYSCVSFGFGEDNGYDLYLSYLKQLLDNTGLPEINKEKLVGFIDQAESLYKYSGMNQNVLGELPRTLNRWLDLFLFDLEVFQEIKKQYQEKPIVPLIIKVNPFNLDLLFINNRISDKLEEVLSELTKELLSKISSVYLLEKKILTDPQRHKLDLIIEERKHNLKTGYSESGKKKESYLDIIEQWFEEEKKFIDDITPLLSNIKNVSSSRTPDNIGELPDRMISFSDNEALDNTYKLLAGYFLGYENELKIALKGEKLKQPIVFTYSQNKLVEVFRRLKYNGYIPNKTSEIRDWLCANFHFRFKRGQIEEVRPLKPDTVWDILSKGRGEPTKRERICFENVDWLPYKSPLQLSRESESEQL